MLSEEQRDVMNKQYTTQAREKCYQTEKRQTLTRESKRQSTRPQYLRYFITNSDKERSAGTLVLVRRNILFARKKASFC